MEEEAGPPRKALESGALPELRVLDADESDFGDAETRQLACAPGRERLERLELFFSTITQTSALALLCAESLPKLVLRTFLSDRKPGMRERFGEFGKRFVLGSTHDRGTPEWSFRSRWTGAW